jgi:hypothetical protein
MLTATGRAMTTEGSTESLQSVFERGQAGLSVNPSDPDARNEYVESFIGGAVLGGALGAPGHFMEYAMGSQQSQPIGRTGQPPEPSPLGQAQRILNQPGMTRERADELVGKLVNEGGVAAMVGYHLRELLETGALPASLTTAEVNQVEVDRKNAQTSQQERQRGVLATGPDAAARLDRFIGSFPASEDTQLASSNPAPHLRITA